MNGLPRPRTVPLHVLADRSREQRTTCSCGVVLASATQAGLLVLAEHHVLTSGLPHHRVVVAAGVLAPHAEVSR